MLLLVLLSKNIFHGQIKAIFPYFWVSRGSINAGGISLQKVSGSISLVQTNFTFNTISEIETDKNLAMLTKTIHFPRPELRDFFDLAFWGPFFEDLMTISKSHINTCNFGSLDMKPTPSLTKDCRKLSLISPTDIDSIAPCNHQIQQACKIQCQHKLFMPRITIIFSWNHSFLCLD